MKQSTKLLSLVLALIMAFSCMSVIGNAALVKGQVKYDSVDDADLTPEQVADIIMDLLDKLIADGDMSDLDLSIIGKVRMDSLDHIIGDFYKLYSGFVWTIGHGLLGDVGDLNLDNMNDCQRTNGDLNFLYDVLELLNNNRTILSKVAYGIGTDNGLSLGLIGSFLSLGDIEDLLADLPGFLETMLFDMLLYGSYDYPKDSEELGGTLPASADTLDEIVNRAIGGLLTYPQDYEYVGEGDDAVKVWDEGSLLLPTAAAYGIDTVTSYFALNDSANSFFTILDKIAPFAIYDLGINALNHNLKKALFEAVEADINEIDVSKLPADLVADFEVDAVDGEESYVNYIAYDRLGKSGNVWYYTTMETETVVDNTGAPVLDAEGNEQTERVRKFFKINTAAANEFYSMINWDWNFYAPVPLSGDTTSDGLNELNYEALIAEYGSIMESLNHLLYVIYETALNDDVKFAFEDLTGDPWIDGPTTEEYADGESNIMYNLTRLGKYLLAEHADKLFGSDSPYIAWEYEDVENMTIIELVAHIGPVFFEDAMPQLILPKNEDGTVKFNDGVQVLEFGAAVIREFMTEIAPNVNYDSYIWKAGTLTSATGREFATHTQEEWFNIILNMGVDIGYVYLNNITNFNTAAPAQAITEARWQGMLDTAIMWAVNYVGTNGSGVLNGLDPTTVSGKSGPFNKLSYFLNTLLPLGFVCGCTTDAWDLDVEVLFDKIKSLLTTMDLTEVASLFGRNKDERAFNLLDDGNFLTNVLNLVNRILKLVIGQDLLPNTTNLNSAITQATLKTIVERLFNGLYNRRAGILENALPVVAKFIQEWGGEQELGTPEIGVSNTIAASGGALTDATFQILNGSKGVWRHYKDANGNEYQDEQYKYAINSIQAFNFDSSASSYVSNIRFSTAPIDFAQGITVTYNVANVPSPGAIVRWVIKYTVYDESGNAMANGAQFEETKYSWISRDPSNEDTEYITDRKGNGDYITRIYSPHYVGLSNAVKTIPNITTGNAQRNSVTFSGEQTLALEYQGAQVVDGIKWGNFTTNAPNEEYRFGGIRNFDTYTATVYNDKGKEGHTYSIAGGVDEAAFLAANKQPGSSSSWTIRVYARGDANNYTYSLIYFDDIALGDLIDLVDDENRAMRTAVEYNTSGTFYATSVLPAKDDTTTTDVNEKETNFTTTAINPDTGEEVTVIDAAQACGEYMAALEEGIRAAYQVWNGASTFEHERIYHRLRVAANDVQYIKKSAEQIAAEGGVSLDPSVAALKATVNSIEAQYSDTMDYTDYKMYRWNRYNDARDDAHDIIYAQKAASLPIADDQYFTYTSIGETDLRALIKGDAQEAKILALLETYSADEYKVRQQELKNAKNHYAGYSLLDVAQASNLMGRMSERLLKRDGGVNATYLNTEIASANAMIGKTNNGYTVRSWNQYIAALENAEKVAANPTQMTAFDAKYNLLVARNELNKIGEEADYTELETLIAQAQQALANEGLYDNTTKEFGQVLAELGYKTFTNADGDDVQLFPGSALLVNAEPYAADDQDEVDDAAAALKEALARLKFKSVTVKYDNVNVNEETLVEDDVKTEGIDETIVAKVSRIAAEKSIDEIKAKFAATAQGITVAQDNITITNDFNYAVDFEGKEDDGIIYVGTNATVTFYTKLNNGTLIPVATAKIVVEGDLNGDGVLDVLDANIAQLTATEHAELDRCYFLAANLNADTGITANDYAAVVNKVLA